MEKPTYTAIPGSLEMVITHKFDAPRDLVYKMYTDPKLIPEWWGPRNLTTTVEKMELRPGGVWRYVQRDPQNNIFPFYGVYHSLEPNRRIISTFEWEGMPGHVILVTTSFDEKDGKTIVIQQNVFQSVQDRDGMIQQGMEQGLTEGDERFNELLAKIKGNPTMGEAYAIHDGKSLIITRTFNASPKQIWQEWTNPNMYMCWWGPKDYNYCGAQVDLRVGGKILNCMVGPDGKQIWSTGTYKEIVEPNRFVVTDSFADEHGNIVPASYYGMTSDLPMELEVEVTLEDLGGRTRMTLEHCGIPEGTIRDQTRQGWNESFDKLENCLK
jgi:uncharacterized protein YndB with AHSA1/START domain